MTFQEQLEKAVFLKKRQLHQQASYLLDELASAWLYNHNYDKQDLDISLRCVKAIKRRTNACVAAFAAMKIREDREQALTCSLTEELASCLAETRQDARDEKSDSLIKIIAFIKENKKLLEALKKNASNQYVNRLLANTVLRAKAAKIKKFYSLNKSLFE